SESALLTGLLIVIALFGLIVAFFLGYYIGTVTIQSQGLLGSTTTTTTTTTTAEARGSQSQFAHSMTGNFSNTLANSRNVLINIDQPTVLPSTAAVAAAAA